MADRKIKILTFTALYPNNTAPHFGVFVENRLRHLIASGAVTAKVVAPRPWFPFLDFFSAEYARLAHVPPIESRHDLEVVHPRYLHIPKIGTNLQPILMYLSVRGLISRILAQGFDFDLIDAHYFYPDGVAAALLAREFRKPFVVTGRGTDLVTLTKQFVPRHLIKWTAQKASGVITVSASLKSELVDLGIDPNHVRVLRNGVDLHIFHPVDRSAVRAKFGFTRSTIASVGHLIPRKGNEFIIRALLNLPQVDLAIVGAGPEHAMLVKLANELGLEDRVRFLGVIPHDALAELYSAVDCLVLASSHEGWPNVLLEAMACGTPVAATAVSGSPEIVCSRDAGLLMENRDPKTIAARVGQLLDDLPDRAATRRYAEDYDWDATTAGQLALFEDILNAKPQHRITK